MAESWYLNVGTKALYKSETVTRTVGGLDWVEDEMVICFPGQAVSLTAADALLYGARITPGMTSSASETARLTDAQTVTIAA